MKRDTRIQHCALLYQCINNLNINVSLCEIELTKCFSKEYSYCFKISSLRLETFRIQNISYPDRQLH